MQYRTLGRTQLKVSVLGFGAATLGNEYGPADPAEAERAVHAAIDHGINLFDVAPYYGRTLAEERLGLALAGRRDGVVLCTKCCRYDVNQFDFSAASVKQSIDESLRRLRTDHVDILFAHDVEFGEKKQILDETVPALHDVKRAGKARFIGVTGLPLGILREIAEAAAVDCVLSYCRYNLLNRDLNDALAPAARERGFGIINASPLHMRLLSSAGPPDWHPAPAAIREAAREIVELCDSQGVPAAALALQFAVRNPAVASTLNGMSTRGEVLGNVKAIEQEPDAALLAKADAIARRVRGVIWPSGRPENSD